MVGKVAGRYCWSKANELVIALDYGPEVLKECKGMVVLADGIYNLQRVDFRPWGISLRIDISLPRPDEKTKESQFELLGDFIREQEVRFSQQWFQIAYEGDDRKAVSYAKPTATSGTAGSAPAPARENLIFNLNELSRVFLSEQPLLGGNIGNFTSCLT